MWTRARFVNEYVPGLFGIAIDTYLTKRAESMWPKLVTVKTSQKKKEENTIRSGLGLPALKGEGAPIGYDTQIGGPKQTWIHNVYALGVRISEEAIDDNLYELKGGGGGDDLKEIFYDLGEAMEYNIEAKMARFFNSGAATTYHTTRFGKALFDLNHPRLDGSTYANYSAAYADLTYAAFWAVLVAAENQYNHRQQLIRKKVKNLWFPPILERKASEILFSPDKPDSGNRAISAYARSNRSITPQKWVQMTDVDSWIMQMEGPGIRFFWRKKTRFGREGDFQTGDMMCKADQRFSAEVDDERDFYAVIP